MSFAEIRKVRQAVYDGSLMELVEERCRAHPRLLDGYRRMSAYADLIEKFEPRSRGQPSSTLGQSPLDVEV